MNPPTKEELQKSKNLGFDENGNEVLVMSRKLGVGMTEYGTINHYFGHFANRWNFTEDRREPWHCDSEGYWTIDKVWARGFELIPEDGGDNVSVWYNGATPQAAKNAIRTIGNYHEGWHKHSDGRWRPDVL